ncbi:hypothetical protein L484_022087 [Morus notabilis]|uniref:Uncharacterized protein n=1 Tax=Morus notabilis TaxID=981085 RepID=W9RPA7_9ROSA|nr:uncharacterized protein LOC21404915 [Morus notabilis]EXC01509.1 hypothetical protein L484_022087 [Morus notabilis]
MLLSPSNGAESHCRNLKLKIDDADPRKFFLCSKECTASKFRLLSYYKGAVCECGKAMSNEVSLFQKELENSPSDAQDGGVFVKVIHRYLISDDLEVMPLCIAATISLLSKYGVTHWSTIEERTFNLGADEVLNLLLCSLVSISPLTYSLLKHLNCVHYFPRRAFGSQTIEVMDQEQKINVKLFVSKSKRRVICAVKQRKTSLIYSTVS